jgi:2-aminoadipate transaminase
MLNWDEVFAARTHSGVGAGLIEILKLADVAELISFAGGFPDPETFPREALLQGLEELVESGDPSPFQYSPTAGLEGPREFIASRLEYVDGRGRREMRLAYSRVDDGLIEEGARRLGSLVREALDEPA